MDPDCSEYDNFTFTCSEYEDDDDDGLYIDMDFSGSTSPLEEDNRDSKEFQFSISSRNIDPCHVRRETTDDISPADDLFYKGQLLPLHLPPRLQMVRNLFMSTESEADNYLSLDSTMSFHPRHHSDRFISSGSEDSKQRPISSKQVEFSSGKSEETHLESILKFPKLKASLFGFKKSSKVDMDDHYCTRSPPTPTKHPRFPVKFNSVKRPLSMGFFAKNYRPKSQKTPDYSSRGTTSEGVLQKYMRIVKHRICQRQGNRSVDEKKLKGKDEVGWPCNSGESGRRSSVSFSGNLKQMDSRYMGIRSCPASMNSSPHHNGVFNTFYGDDLQSAIQGAIAHCKKSNGSPDTHNIEDPANE